MKRFDDTSCLKPSGCISNQSCSFLDFRAVKSTCDIILDSGSDATVIPVSMTSAGNAAQDQTSYLRDAQGARIETEGVRDVSIVLTTVDGVEITIRDKAHVSSRVDCLLISYGKLLRHGWGIVPEGGKSFFSSYQCYSTGAYLTLSLRWCSEKASRMSFLVPLIDCIGGFQLVTSWRAYGPPWWRGALPRTVSLFASDVNRHSCPSAMCSWLTLEHTQQWDVPTLGGDCGRYLCGHWLIQPGQAVHKASHWICGLATFVLAIAKLRNL